MEETTNAFGNFLFINVDDVLDCNEEAVLDVDSPLPEKDPLMLDDIKPVIIQDFDKEVVLDGSSPLLGKDPLLLDMKPTIKQEIMEEFRAAVEPLTLNERDLVKKQRRSVRSLPLSHVSSGGKEPVIQRKGVVERSSKECNGYSSQMSVAPGTCHAGCPPDECYHPVLDLGTEVKKIKKPASDQQVRRFGLGQREPVVLLQRICCATGQGRCPTGLCLLVHNWAKNNSAVMTKKVKKEEVTKEEVFKQVSTCDAENQKSEEKNLICKFCGKEFESWLLLKRHTGLHSRSLSRIEGGRKLRSVYKSRFSVGVDLEKLKLPVHKGKIHICDICKKRFLHRSELVLHIRSVHIKYRCNFCNKHFSDKTNLEVHILSAHVVYNHMCNVCNERFSNSSYLKEHILLAHNGYSQTCTVCNKHFKQTNTLKRHFLLSHKDQMYKYNLSNKGFSVKHKDGKTPDHNGQNYTCYVCKKSFRSEVNLQKHIRWVHEGVKHLCNVCNKQFANNTNLEKHICLVHKGHRYICRVCSKHLTSPGSLKRHFLLLHKGQMYKPNFYNGGFSVKHTVMVPDFKGQTNFCYVCKRSFTRKYSLQTHIRVVHEGVKHPCNVCNKSYSTSSNLKFHILSVH